MCRITGFLTNKKNISYDFNKIIIKMRDTMTKGGPDDAGFFTDEKSGIALGHRRLSIIDLTSGGHQPMIDKANRYVIVYNGEVYNYNQIKDELIAKGYTFYSTCDTEVLLNAFVEWGYDCVHRFRGMFAFAIWDVIEKKLYLCRDRVGVKPLYYYIDNETFMFSSELKAFHEHPDFKKELNMIALSKYLSAGYIPGTDTIFKNTYKLEAGYFLSINSEFEVKKYKYWDIREYYLKQDKKYGNIIEVISETESILRESFKYRMVSDVPVGIFLSGGIDSSLLVSLLSDEGYKLKTFTIGFYDNKFNEANYAKELAGRFGTEHTELYCSEREVMDVVPMLPELYDEPFGDTSALPTYLVSQLARSKVTVSLSADGGDELFAGYSRYWNVLDKFLPKYNNIFFRNLINFGFFVNPDFYASIASIFMKNYDDIYDKFNKLKVLYQSSDFNEFYFNFNRFYLPEELKGIGLMTGRLNPAQDINSDPLHKMMLTDFLYYLPDDILVKVDRASMACSLESREPFLDNRIIEYIASIPSDFKYRDGVSKYILKEILYQFVPKEKIERPKKGFAAPVGEWLKIYLKEHLEQVLSEKYVKEQGIFNSKFIQRLLNDFLNGKKVNSQKIWFLYVFQMWYARWMVK